MVYSDFYFQTRGKLSVILIALASLSLMSFAMFFFGTNSAPTRASKKILPRHEMTNITPNQAGIFWQTESKELGWIMYGTSENNLTNQMLDERDVEDKKTPMIYHYVFLKNLEKDTVYYYKILSNNEVVSQANGHAFSFRTPKIQQTSQSIKPAYGKVLQANGEPVQNAIVLYYYENASPLLALTKTTGEWLIPLQYVVDKQTLEPVAVDEKKNAKIQILAEDMKGSTIMALVKKTNPVPQSIIMGKDYTMLTDDADVLPATDRKDTQTGAAIDIIYPRPDAVVPAVRPLLKGVALPGKDVKITIDRKPLYESMVKTDAKGEWRSEITAPLVPGTYTMQAVSTDDKNRRVVATRKFTIAKSGEQVLGEATASGQVTATPTPTRSASPTIATPTTAPTISVTGLPNTGTSITPTPSTLLGTGFSPNMLVFISLGLLVMGAGFLIVF